MNLRCLFFAVACSCVVSMAFAGNGPRLTASMVSGSEMVVVIDHALHLQYGCLYPLTYQVRIPPGSGGLRVLEKHQVWESAWLQAGERTSADTFNAIEAVRFEYGRNIAYISAAFSGASDSLFIQVVDSLNHPVPVSCEGISTYYDDRKAAVTVSFDDWADWMSVEGVPIIDLFRSHGLYLTGGVITQYTSAPTWALIQAELDSGFVEVASHSRNHLQTPYDTSISRVQYSSVSEIGGSAQDIRNALRFPAMFTLNGTKYVYTWIAPDGDYDQVVDSLLGVFGYLDARLYANLSAAAPRAYVYGDSTLQSWDAVRNHFRPFFPTVELGAPSWGGGDTSLVSLNGLFDAILQDGDVYHMMWHPQVLYTDVNKGYLRAHLDYVSGRTNVWYVSLGHLYLYHLLQSGISVVTTPVAASRRGPDTFRLLQNYPNPFNPSTVISYELPARALVVLKVFDVLGREITTLINEQQGAGAHSVKLNAANLPSGTYFYRMQAGNFNATKRLMVLR